MIILGLGSNLGDRLQHLRHSIQLLHQHPALTIQSVSPLYCSAAVLPSNAPASWNLPYINAVITANTTLSPLELLAYIKTIETQLGRPPEHLTWSPRTIDIDIIAWDAMVIDTQELKIPHPHLLARPFVVIPMAAIAPQWRYPRLGSDHGRTISAISNELSTTMTPDTLTQINQRIDTPVLMGIVNITPDSFSHDGLTASHHSSDIIIPQLITKITELVNAGSEIIDLGAAASNPDATAISPQEEVARLLPILENIKPALQHLHITPKISIDTQHAQVAASALAYDIDFINDVGGLHDPAMRELVQQSKIKTIFMHNLGIPAQRSQVLPPEVDVVALVYEWAKIRLAELSAMHIPAEQLIFDVGIGFGKTATQSLALLQGINKFHDLPVPLLVGHSRKSFLNQFYTTIPKDRDLETAWLSWYLAQHRVAYLRVHNIAATSRLFRLGSVLATAATVTNEPQTTTIS